MNISANRNVATPSFQARLKKNDIAEKMVKQMSPNDAYKMYDALNKLSKMAPNDILEIKRDESCVSETQYAIVNTANNECAVIGNKGYGSLADVMTKLADKSHYLHKRFFGADQVKAKTIALMA